MRKAACFLAALLLCSPFASAEWPQWRGPLRDGKSDATGLLPVWPEGGPNLLWQVESLGEGFASYSFADGKLFTQGQKDGRQYLIALDAKTGETAWEVRHGETYGNNRGNGPRGTPTIDGERIYALGADGNLICASVSTGEKIWEVNLLAKFGGSNIKWGLSESPLIDRGRVIVNAGGPGASVVALNKNDGSLIWKSESDEAGYSSAVIAEVGGIRMYVMLTGEAAIGLRADTGELLWRYAKVSNPTANIATPIVQGDLVFVSTDYGTGCALLKLVPANGGIQSEEIYFNRDMRNHYSSSVLIDGYLYGYSSRILTCMKFETGEVMWQDRSVGKGQVLYADGRLYLLSEDGVVGMAEVNPNEYKEISRFEISRGNYPTWTLPVIVDGVMYLRDQELLYAYDVKGQ
ncbi:MAG: PQQ-binding-like beta-propeller repeat protein [Bryobacterales bacterium]